MEILFVIAFYLIAVLTGMSIQKLRHTNKIGKIIKRTDLELEVYKSTKDKLTIEERNEISGRIDGRITVIGELLK